MIMEPFKSHAVWFVKEVVKLLHCKNYDIYEIQDKLKIVASFSELVRGCSSQKPENQGFLKEAGIIGESGNPGQSDLLRNMVIEMPKKQAEI